MDNRILTKLFAGKWHSGAIILLLVVLQSYSSSLHDALSYDRSQISSGEVWRIITAHFLHLSWAHLLANILGYCLLTLLYLESYSWPEDILLVSILAAAVGGLLYLFAPKTDWYLGFSGVLIGLYAYYSVAKIKKLPRQGAFILLVLVVKILREHWFETEITSWWGNEIPVVIDAHLFGLMSGITFGLCSLGFRASQPKSGHHIQH